ncbi:MAG TPA: hypothetical protein VFB02_12950 [Bradyrhizobium sp.]|jgi:putative flippase GtrA|nr:hypothetical protein [Bradyrhizobium sp.]
MLKIASLIWVMLGTVLAGTAVTTVLTVQGLVASPMKAIPLAALAGFVVAMPLSYLVATKIGRTRDGRRTT